MSLPLHLFYVLSVFLDLFHCNTNLVVTITDLRRDAEDEQRTLFEHLHCIELEV